MRADGLQGSASNRKFAEAKSVDMLQITSHRGRRRWRVSRDQTRNLGSPQISRRRVVVEAQAAKTARLRTKDLWMAESAVVAKKRVMPVERRAGR